MDINAIQDEIAYFLRAMDNQPEDPQELYQQLHEKLSEIRAFGMPVPQDLSDLEARLRTLIEQETPSTDQNPD